MREGLPVYPHRVTMQGIPFTVMCLWVMKSILLRSSLTNACKIFSVLGPWTAGNEELNEESIILREMYQQ